MEQSVLPGRYQTVPRVLCFVTRGDEVLLLRGASDKPIWADRYNGVGGHVEEGEDVVSAARREILEETGLDIDRIALRGVVNIQTSTPRTGVLMFVFVAQATCPAVRSSPEGSLEWVPLSRVRQLPVVADVPMLLERALSRSTSSGPFFASYGYRSDGGLDVAFAP
jgi:8-oxo-dGTP diphosphatase